MLEVRTREELLADRSGRDICWHWLRPSAAEPDPRIVRSNVSLRCFRERILAGSQGRILLPAVSLYRYHRLRMTPIMTPHAQRLPEWVQIHDRYGRAARPILPRTAGTALRPCRNIDSPFKKGRYVYLGLVIMHHGHLLTEFLSRMWIDPRWFGDDARFLVQARPEHRQCWREERGWSCATMREIMRAFGLSPERLEFVERDAVYETVYAPTPLNAYPQASRPEVSGLYARLARHYRTAFPDVEVPDVGPRVYLSRRLLPEDRRSYSNEAELERIFADRGFSVVHPQQHPVAAQIRMMRTARIIAGGEGSAFCGAMFADAPEVFYIESGRFHSSLPNLLYHHVRRFYFMVPQEDWEHMAPASLFGKLYLPPQRLARLLDATYPTAGPVPVRPTVGAEAGERYLGIFEASQRMDVEGCAAGLARLVRDLPREFRPDVLVALRRNLELARLPQELLEQFDGFCGTLLQAYAAYCGARRRGPGGVPCGGPESGSGQTQRPGGRPAARGR